MVGQNCSRQAAFGPVEQDIDCERVLYIDESSRHSAAADGSGEPSASPSPVLGGDKSVDEPTTTTVGSASCLPKNPKSSLSKLESLVNNLMERKTRQLAETSGKNDASAVASSAASAPLGGVLPPAGRSLPTKAPARSAVDGPDVSGLPSYPTVRRIPPIAVVPGIPAMMPPGLPHAMPPPFLPPFGFAPFHMMPPLPMCVPCLPPMPVARAPRHAELSLPSDLNLGASEELPLDLTTSCKKRYPHPGYPGHHLPKELLPNGSPAALRALFNVHVPQIVKPNLAVKDELRSPRPSILPRSGKSAFVAVKAEPVTVKAECWGSASSTDRLVASQSVHVKELSIYEHNVLQAELLQAANKPKVGAAIRRLQQTYRNRVDQIELDRHKTTAGMDDRQVGELGVMFDNQRLLLAKQFTVELAQEKIRLGMMAGGGVSGAPSMMSFPAMPVIGGLFPPFDGAALGSSFPVPPRDNPWRPTDPVPDHDDGSPDSTYDSNSAGESSSERGQKRKFLCPNAVDILNHWYGAHFDHPYPDETAVDEMARQGNITPPQVKKWMANKRVRSCNTLAFNGSIHPKKLQKLMQLKESSLQVGRLDLPSVAPSRPPSSEKKSQRLLNPMAVDYMNKWYAEHLNYPYPTDDEKTRIASEAGLSLPQVTCWFANKRNRSNNTKKISTKTMWQKLSRKMQIMGAMNLSPEVKVELPMEANVVA